MKKAQEPAGNSKDRGRNTRQRYEHCLSYPYYTQGLRGKGEGNLPSLHKHIITYLYEYAQDKIRKLCIVYYAL